MTKLRIATYNIHKCKGLDFQVRPSRIARVIEEIDADAIALQEVFDSQAEHLADLLRLPYVFDPASEIRGKPYGNAVFTKLPVVGSQSFDLSVHLREPRRCLRVDLALPAGNTLHLWTAHLGTSFFERRHQAVRLASHEVLHHGDRAGPRILVGDFNEWTRGLVTRTLSECMRSADITYHLKRGRTYPGIVPFLHLDHIYYDPPLELTALHLHKTKTALVASDHLPLWGNFSLPLERQNSVSHGVDDVINANPNA